MAIKLGNAAIFFQCISKPSGYYPMIYVLRERCHRKICDLPGNTQAHAGSSGSGADVSQPQSQAQFSGLNSPKLYQL